MFVVKNRDLFN